MNPFIDGFKDSAHLAGEICGFSNGKVIRQFGLGDFLENLVTDADNAHLIALKALAYFCKDANPHSEVFKFGVLTVGSFLNHYSPRHEKQPPQQPLKDLVRLLTMAAPETEISKWMAANFE